MKTRPKPVLSLREIYESQIDPNNPIWTLEQQQSLFNVFVALAVGLENTDNNLDYVESDLVEETERRVECDEMLKHQFEEYIQQQNSEIRELESDVEEVKIRQSEAVYMRDMPEILADICKRLDKLEYITKVEQIERYPDLLK